MTEHWLPVVGYEGAYEVSDHGHVRGVDRLISDGRRRRGQMMRLKKQANGYLAVGLRNGVQQRRFLVHRLVLAAFRGPCPDGMVACHDPDNDRSNNCIENLRWDTYEGNFADRDRHGTTARGERQGTAKLNETDIERIFDLRRNGCTLQQIADWLGVGMTTIGEILRRENWRHVEIAA